MTLIESSSSERFLDPDVAQLQASDPLASVWVGASAGSGKTKVLTDRVLRLMLAGTPPARILCLTFTKAAAAEMAIRINRTLGTWATLPEDKLTTRLTELCGAEPSAETRTAARRLFARVVDCPGGMKIQTIHAFCQSLLRRFPVEASLAPHFEVMDDRMASVLLDEVRDTVLYAGRTDPLSELGQALSHLTAELNGEKFADIMAELVKERGRISRIFNHHGGCPATIAEVFRTLGVPLGRSKADILSQACYDDALDVAALREACRALSTGSDKDQERGIGIQQWLDTTENRLNTLETYMRRLLTKEGSPLKTLLTKKPATAHPKALEALEEEAQRLVALTERARSAAVAASTAALLTLAEALLNTYKQRKRQRSLLDYDDLILSTHALLTGEGRAPWVLYKLDGGLDHILIDEAQDTNPEQWQVISAIAEEFFAGLGSREEQSNVKGEMKRTVFAVGDEKQSIFSFQRADPAEFARMRRHFQERAIAAQRIWQPVDLDISFRSTAVVLQTVDAVFAAPSARDGVIPKTNPALHHRAFRRGQAGLVELWPPVKPREQPDPTAWDPPLVREAVDSPPARLAAVIAETICGWLKRADPLPTRGRAIQPGDIMVLVRRRNNFVVELVRALKDRAVPVAGVDRMVLTEQLAVMDLMAVADFLLLPEDDLTLATVLKGPLIGLTEDELYTLAHGRKGTLWQSLVGWAEGNPGFRPARAYLGDLLTRTDFIPPYELFAGILSAPCPASTVSGRRAVLSRLGPDAQDPLDEFLSVCLSFERTETPSLQGFLAWLAASKAEIKRELEQGGGHVRIMTVHGSKGLEAPIVFLPDTLSAPIQSPPILWPDEQATVPLFALSHQNALCLEARARANRRRDQEYRRLLYVALTRAADRLYICGWQGVRAPVEGCWHRLVENALSAVGESVDFDFTTLSPDGWSGPGWRLADMQTAAPHDKSVIATLIHAAPALPPWVKTPAPLEPEPSRPLTPSRPDGVEPAVRSPLGEDDGARFRRGILVHRLLQTLPDLPPAVRESACRRFLAGPAHRLTTGQQDEITRETMAVLNGAAFAHLFAPGSRAETPVVGVVEGRALSGQIDRLVITAEAVWIIDYKTNRPPPREIKDVPGVYVRQMAAYRAALTAIYPDRPVRCVLLWTDGPFLMELPQELLNAGDSRSMERQSHTAA